MAADNPERNLDSTGEAPSVDPSIGPSASRRQKLDGSAGQALQTGVCRRSDNPHVDVARRPRHRRTSTGPRCRELLQALGIFHRAGIGHLLGFQTEIGHRLGSSFVQRADLVVRAPEAGVPVLLVEVDRRTEDAHDLVAKLRRYWEWGRLLPKDAAKSKVDLVRSRPDAIEHVDHDKRLWRRVYPPTGREGLVPLAFVFADTTAAKVANTVAVLEEAGRRYWAPRRYDCFHRNAVTARDYRHVVPVVVTTLEQLQEHGADAAVWRRLGRDGEQTLTDALDNPDGHALYRAQEARADAEDQRRCAAQREADRPVCTRCGWKFTDERWEEITVHRTAVRLPQQK